MGCLYEDVLWGFLMYAIRFNSSQGFEHGEMITPKSWHVGMIFPNTQKELLLSRYRNCVNFFINNCNIFNRLVLCRLALVLALVLVFSY